MFRVNPPRLELLLESVHRLNDNIEGRVGCEFTFWAGVKSNAFHRALEQTLMKSDRSRLVYDAIGSTAVVEERTPLLNFFVVEVCVCGYLLHHVRF